jgi:hypothetical protein
MKEKTADRRPQTAAAERREAGVFLIHVPGCERARRTAVAGVLSKSFGDGFGDRTGRLDGFDQNGFDSPRSAATKAGGEW